MHYKLLFPNDYLGAHDLKGAEFIVEIERVVVEELTMTGGRKEKKPIIYFKGAKKKMVCNKTNAKTIARQLGNDTEQWVGKKITVIPTTDKFGSETVECIRVKKTGPQLKTE